MTDPKSSEPNPADLAADLAAARGTDAPGEEEASIAPETSVEAERDAALVQAADLKDKLLRTLADMENLRRRSEREAADARTYAVTAFARDLLSVADNIRRAFEAVPPGTAEAEGPLKAFVDGIGMTERELMKVLEKHGVRTINPQGERFDPNQHQAMFEVPNPELPNGTVAQVVQVGFTIGERVLRPALVGVSKGGPKAPPTVEKSA